MSAESPESEAVSEAVNGRQRGARRVVLRELGEVGPGTSLEARRVLRMSPGAPLLGVYLRPSRGSRFSVSALSWPDACAIAAVCAFGAFAIWCVFAASWRE